MKKKDLGLGPGLKAAGPVLSLSEAEYIAKKKGKTLDEVMSKAVAKGISLGSNLVNSYNDLYNATYPFSSQSAYAPQPPENLTGIVGLDLGKGQVYSGVSAKDEPVISKRKDVVSAYQQQQSPVPEVAVDATVETATESETPSLSNKQKFKKAFKAAEKAAVKTREEKAEKAQDEVFDKIVQQKAEDAEFQAKLDSIKSGYASKVESDTNTALDDREAEMLNAYERTLKKIQKDSGYGLKNFKKYSYSGKPEVEPGVFSEEGISPGVTYEELLNKLRQTKKGYA